MDIRDLLNKGIDSNLTEAKNFLIPFTEGLAGRFLFFAQPGEIRPNDIFIPCVFYDNKTSRIPNPGYFKSERSMGKSILGGRYPKGEVCGRNIQLRGGIWRL